MPGRSSNSANPTDNYKFTGHERDDEAGLTLDYMMARNYDPTIARFMSIDPLANMYPSWTPYHYVHNNPLNLVDPNGMMACEDDNKICQWWADFTATVGEVLKNAQVNITFNFGEDGEVTATSEVSQEQTMMANAMLQDLKDHGEKVEGMYNTMRELPGGDVMIPIMEGNPGEASVNAATYFIPVGKGVKIVSKSLKKLDPVIVKKIMNAAEKGVVGATGQQGIKTVAKTEALSRSGYTHKIKILGKGGDTRVYGKQQSDGSIVFDKVVKGHK